MTACSRRYCTGEARWRVVLVLAAPAAVGPHVTWELILGFVVCDACRCVTTVESVVGDEAWEEIVDSFDVRGMPRPERSATRLDFVPFGSWRDLVFAGASQRNAVVELTAREG